MKERQIIFLLLFVLAQVHFLAAQPGPGQIHLRFIPDSLPGKDSCLHDGLIRTFNPAHPEQEVWEKKTFAEPGTHVMLVSAPVKAISLICENDTMNIWLDSLFIDQLADIFIDQIRFVKGSYTLVAANPQFCTERNFSELNYWLTGWYICSPQLRKRPPV